MQEASIATPTFTAPIVTTDTTLTFSLIVTDNDGLNSTADTIDILVKNVNQPPIAKAVVLPSQTVAKGTLVTLDGSTSTDPDQGDSIASFKWEQTAGSPAMTLNGASTAKATFTAPSVTIDTTFTFKLTVTDKQSVSSSVSVNVFVQKDTQQPPSNKPPDTSKATPSTSTLWPPNHKMVKITIQNVKDLENNNPVTIKITQIMQDEPVNGLGDGDTSPDGSGIGTSTAQLRSERADSGDGRVYHIYFTATDSKGQSANGEVVVSVPHDQSGRKVIDSGPKYDSTLKSSTVDTAPPVIVGTTP